jgi:hypothetical protein
MSSQYLPAVIIGVVVVGFIIYRQLERREIEGRRLVVLPLALALLGIFNLDKEPPASGAAVTALVASMTSAVVFGLARGVSTRVWQDPDGLMRQGTSITLGLWIISIALRIGIGAVAHRAGVSQSVTFGELPLFLGVTLAAQNVVIWMRAQALAVPPPMRTRSLQ